ncbi:hypothetical protein DQ239_05305 [Blastococcus sp. TF02-09]|uniref:hypothetical protein n=1 Tax=Blastococcus sp. TF02-09 TaxID=2250576 RepID=UPI000DE8677B|nr:hypothetical protein [Blastococcus sp. TF02-9]RBY79086.1 hypothetical protein DQ239_05305 [Blastococcus sp. TF02-9]
MTDGTRAPTRELGDDATAEAAERAREELLTQCGTQLPLLAGIALLLVEPQRWSSDAWYGAAALLLVAGTAVWQYGTRHGQEGQAEVLVAEYAVLRSVDPGVGRRHVADETAKRFAWTRFIAWPLWLGAVGLLLVFGQWGRPAWALPGAVLVVVAAAVHLTAREREARAGRRWRADPPGPPRD